jgi:hypothetical protein
MKLAAVALTIALCLTAQTKPSSYGLVFERQDEVYVSTWVHPPVWSGNMLLRFEDNLTNSPLIDAVDRDLKHEAISFDIPGAVLINIRALGGASDSTILVGGNAFSGDSRRAGFIARISPDRKKRTLIQTEPFRAESVAVAADGAIWAVGHLFDGEEGRHNTFNIIQRYDAGGTMLTSRQVAGAKAWTNIPYFADQSSHLLASQDRVGWLTNGCQYIEFSLDGAELHRFAPPDGMEQQGTLDGMALSKGNDVILGRKGSQGTELLVLDRTTGSWSVVLIAGHTATYGLTALGFDGDTLVTSQVPGMLNRFHLNRAPEQDR